MNRILSLVFVLAVVATPALADDGNVSQAALADLGLGNMQVVSDTAGMEVRGMSSNALAFGASLVFGQLLDINNPGNFFVASDTNGGIATAENAGLNAASLAANGPQGSSIIGNLTIQVGNPLVPVFNGMFLGNAGNAANPGLAGLSAAMAN